LVEIKERVDLFAGYAGPFEGDWGDCPESGAGIAFKWAEVEVVDCSGEEVEDELCGLGMGGSQGEDGKTY
jgi:hypothetical protein